MGLLPRLYGQDISKMFKQNYRGNVTIGTIYLNLDFFIIMYIISTGTKV
jgi:hypothetical protein